MKRYRKSFFKWITISLMCLYFGFMVGKFKQDILENSIQLLELDVTNLRAENQALTEQLNLTQADLVAEKQVNEVLSLENKELNAELDANHNKLYFYERVVAPELAVKGLNIYSFYVSRANQDNLWNYELVLMQSQKGRRWLKGKVDFVFDYADDNKGKHKAIKLSTIDKNFKPSFKFKYFQRIKGQFTLPEDVKADQLFVVAEAAGNRWNRAQRIEKVYDWKDFINSAAKELKELENQADSE